MPRKGNLFNPKSKVPFKLSRSKIEFFITCQRCFYLDRRLGIKQPGGYPFNLNIAVDILLKKEFDIHRARQKAHPLMKTYGVQAIPFSHEELDTWRENFKGMQYHHKPTNFIITGAIDDIWRTPKGELIIVDYKATSKNGKITLDAPWQDSYKRQMEVYQWILRKKGFSVSDIGYFVYCNAKRDRKAFDGVLEFDIEIISYTGNDSWIEGSIIKAHECLLSDTLPAFNSQCEYCRYRKDAKGAE